MTTSETRRFSFVVFVVAALVSLCIGDDALKPSQPKPSAPFNSHVGSKDWPQFGGSPHRNNTSIATNAPTEWNIETGENIKWSASLGSQTYGSPVVANGKIYVGTNNAAGYLKRYPKQIDLGVLLCFQESDGEFLWQYSSPKLPTGRVNDWPLQGICSTPVVEGDRVWFVSNRGEVVCLDAEGFRDGENDGPFQSEMPEESKAAWDESHEADTVWSFDMMKELGVSQHNMANCAPTIWGDVLFICTSNGVDESHVKIPAVDAPSFIAMDKISGKVLWTDNSPGKNIMHGQWSSPAVGDFDGKPQVLFAGGDGWLYSFRADRWADGKPELVWKFDGNPKVSKYLLGGRSTRNGIIAPPVIDDGLVYLAMGEDPEHGEGNGHLWCIDPTRVGDVSPELAIDKEGNSMPHRRVQAVDTAKGEQAIPNPNSAVVWHYDYFDQNGNGKADFEETMHRTLGGPAFKNGLLFVADFAGLMHCLNAKTGQVHWTRDMFAASWSTPLIVRNRIYAASEDGDVSIFTLSSDPSRSATKSRKENGLEVIDDSLKIPMGSSIYSAPVVANNVLYIATKNELFAIARGATGKRRTPP